MSPLGPNRRSRTVHRFHPIDRSLGSKTKTRRLFCEVFTCVHVPKSLDRPHISSLKENTPAEDHQPLGSAAIHKSAVVKGSGLQAPFEPSSHPHHTSSNARTTKRGLKSTEREYYYIYITISEALSIYCIYNVWAHTHVNSCKEPFSKISMALLPIWERLV